MDEYGNTEFKDLVGEILDHVDIFPKDKENPSEIILTTRSGKKFKIYHSQDCCEHVFLESVQGEWKELIGQTINEVSNLEKDASDEEQYNHATRTILKFKADYDTVITKWYGSSNGYYSESVNIRELKGEDLV